MTSEKTQRLFTDFVPVILAGGRSRRMGRPKPYLKIGGMSFLQRIAAALRRAGIDAPGVVVINAKNRALYDAAPLSNFSVIENAFQERGQLYSLQLALREIGDAPSGVLMQLADHPFVSSDTYKKLAADHAAHPEKIIIPVYKGKNGHPLILPQRLFNKTLELSVEIPGGLRNLIRGHEDSAMKIPRDDPHILSDMDYPEDLEKIRLV